MTSNRSHAFFKLGRYEEALEDAERTISIRPDWGKGYFRKGMALQGLGKKKRLKRAKSINLKHNSCSSLMRENFNIF